MTQTPNTIYFVEGRTGESWVPLLRTVFDTYQVDNEEWTSFRTKHSAQEFLNKVRQVNHFEELRIARRVARGAKKD